LFADQSVANPWQLPFESHYQVTVKNRDDLTKTSPHNQSKKAEACVLSILTKSDARPLCKSAWGLHRKVACRTIPSGAWS
jgi:hypothetical protein